MKTAITVLQEMMVKLGEVPEYECISQSGPHHQASFEYRCVARGESATAVARSKKEAKQDAARALLARLALRGLSVPPPYGLAQPARAQSGSGSCSGGGGGGGGGAGAGAGGEAVDSRSFVALLKELCVEYKLPAVEYELVGDTGPPHMRRFTIRARIGQHSRLATHTTKKAARQQAAEALYHYLKENLRTTRDFVEEDALARAHERAMDRYVETRADTFRPPLAQRPADYHLDERSRELAVEALGGTRAQPAEVALGCAASALGLEVQWAELPRAAAPASPRPPPLHVVTLSPSAPPLAFAATTRAGAAAAARAYLDMALPAIEAAEARAQPVDLLA